MTHQRFLFAPVLFCAIAPLCACNFSLEYLTSSSACICIHPLRAFHVLFSLHPLQLSCMHPLFILSFHRQCWSCPFSLYAPSLFIISIQLYSSSLLNLSIHPLYSSSLFILCIHPRYSSSLFTSLYSSLVIIILHTC